MYLIGGFASAAVHESIDTVDMFDPRTKTWKQGYFSFFLLILSKTFSSSNATVSRAFRRGRSKWPALRSRRFRQFSKAQIGRVLRSDYKLLVANCQYELRTLGSRMYGNGWQVRI